MSMLDFVRGLGSNGCIGMATMALSAVFAASSLAQTTEPTTAPTPVLSNEPPPHVDNGKPTLWIVGDSTVRNGSANLKGWGEVITPFFDTTRINVENRAIGGRSSRTFITEGRWDKILADCKPGDFVLVQMGHNDSSPVNEKVVDKSTRARGTIRGVGEETEEVDNILTKKHEVVHTYGWYMRKYVNDAKEKGMTPIVCSPIPRLPKEVKEEEFKKPATERGSYVQWSAEVAKQTGVQFIDLNQIILTRYLGMTGDEIKAKYFPADGTHTNEVGAIVNAQCVVEGLRALPDAPLAKFLRPETK